ncbi:arabinogalactan-like protein [Asticcacaulis biprosthecium C19]|uniref:Arabinogalactan-like protein n=2 Tax=Asticcacaulis biprosthecium TaxID=76891 RepID=F4QM74_9CAUL|nr:arabinogalactan-like protein [Asticcacaulis biprosthecium C19]
MIMLMAVPGLAQAACNTARGAIDNQPEPPPLDTSATSTIGTAAQMIAAQSELINPLAAPAQLGAAIANAQLDEQTIPIDLSKDVDSLIGFAGHYTKGVPVLGIRFENTPGFDAKTHCNAIQPFVYKPKMEKLEDGRIRASVENGRFTLEFDPKSLKTAWVRDADPSKQFFWVFPRMYGRSVTRPWVLTTAYNTQFQAAPKGSAKRRWVAEAFINLAMRQYRLSTLNKGWPQGYRPTRADLTAAVHARVGSACDQENDNLICLASHLIELNEAPPPGIHISADAFRVGDAGYQNSGVSTGIRQLDFGTTNVQAKQLVKVVLPTTVGRYEHGYGYRRPIRTWDIGTLNRWYDEDGPLANAELSREDAKQALIDSHGAFLEQAVGDWTSLVDKAYPAWPASERKAVALIGIDLENVSGYRLRLPQNAKNLCDVLTNRVVKPKDQRSNASVVDAQRKRVVNGVKILIVHPATENITRDCIIPLPPAPPVVTPPPVTPSVTPPVTAPVTPPVTPASLTPETPATYETPAPALPTPDNSNPPAVSNPSPLSGVKPLPATGGIWQIQTSLVK